MDIATIEETNRIRLSLGMKPLPVPGAQQAERGAASDTEGEAASTLESLQAQAYENYRNHLDAEASKKRREAKAAAVRKARDQAQRFTLLEGKGLSEADGSGNFDAKTWLMGQKKRLKKIEKARKLEEELAAAEVAAAEAVQYTSKDLAGIQVAHDNSAFLQGDEQILTLKDATIDENDQGGDELENIELREGEELTERLELLKKKPGYNFEDDEIRNRSILSQYDEEIYGKQTKKFTLDSTGAIAELSDILDQPSQKTRNGQNMSLDDIVGDAPASSDYLAPSEIKVKKPPKKKSRSTRQKPLDDDDIFPAEQAKVDENAMQVDSGEAAAAKPVENTDPLMDNDDLQATLAIQRKNALKKRKRVTPQAPAKQLKETPGEPDHSDNEGLVVGELTEFVAALSKHEEEAKQTAKRQRRTMSPGREAETQSQDYAMGESGGMYTPQSNATDGAGAQDNRIEEEKTIGAGMGSTLALLRERGLIEESQADSSHKSHHDRQGFLKRKRQLKEELDEKARQQRERDRASGKLERMSRADRDEYARQQNAWRDHQHSLKMAELIESSYKPNVQLKYTDDHGRRLDQKEAFKHLSHQFHGKGSGKGKTEKKLKQIDDEKWREAQSLFDASQGGGMSAATTQQLKKRREAGVRLG